MTGRKHYHCAYNKFDCMGYSDIPVNSGIKPFRGKWTEAEAKHLLKRTLFGAGKKDIELFAGKSAAECVALLLNTPEAMPAPPVNDYNDLAFTDPDVPAGQTWVNEIKANGTQNIRRMISWKSWWMQELLNQNITLREKMVVFWHNHFVIEARTVGSLMSYRNNTLLRAHALGNFKQLTREVTKDMAMLKYLNGAVSTKKAPDENYGRELQELFTVGKGPGSHYTESDVKAAAKLLTGYTIDYKTMTTQFNAARHDEGDKQFSAYYNKTLIKGRKGKDGEEELDELLEMVFAQEEVARFICRKLYRFFVYHHIDAATEKNIITPLAKTFRNNNYEIKPVLEQLLLSRHFFDPGNRGGIIKSPLDFVVGLCREFEVKFAADMDIAERSAQQMQLYRVVRDMQQDIGDPPNVAGWPAWYQEPQFDKIWVNSDTLPRRNSFSASMLSGGLGKGPLCRTGIDVLTFTQKIANPGNPDALIAEAIRLLYIPDLSAKDKEQLKSSILLSGLQGKMSDHYWTQAWQKLTDKPDDKQNRNSITVKLKALYKYLMNLPQYQVC